MYYLIYICLFKELEDADLKWKLYNMLISSLGAHSTKTNALHRVTETLFSLSVLILFSLSVSLSTLYIYLFICLYLSLIS